MRTWLVVGMCVLLAGRVWAGDLGQTKVELDGRTVTTAETNLGNFVADALRAAGGADIGLVHAMAFRPNALIAKGIVTDQDIRRVLLLPTDQVAVLTLKPTHLRAVLQRAFSRYPDPNNGFLQVSGMQVTVDSAKPAATRVTEIRVNGKVIDFADVKTTYTVAMPLGLAKGAVGYVQEFGQFKDAVTVKDASILDALTAEWARLKGSIAPAVEGRLKILKPKE